MAGLRQFFYDRYRDIEIAEHQLLYLFLEVTRACNLSCRHCGSDCGSEDRIPILTLRNWRSIVDHVSARFPSDLLFVVTGGEPLVWPHLVELGRRIRLNRRRWGMVTNGFALDREMLVNLMAAEISSITISLDGKEDAHNHLRNNSHAYARALHAIELVGKSGIPFRDVVTCVFPKNLDSLAQIADLVLEAGIPNWRLFRIFPQGRARNNPDLLLSRAQSWRMVEWIRENRRRYAKAGLRINFSCEGWFPFRLDRSIRSEPFFCRSGVNIASILCDGTVTGCANNGPAFVQGNALRDDFALTWDKGFEKLRNRDWMRNGLCADCRHFAHCRGGSVHLWDDAKRSPSFCYIRE